ncbi:MAG: hypothetical protein E4G95_06335, partial [Bacteroidia bacterium]
MVYNRYLKYLILYLLVVLPGRIVFSVPANFTYQAQPQDTVRTQTKSPLRYPFRDYSGRPWEDYSQSPLFLSQPSNIRRDVVYDGKNNEYIIYEMVGELEYRRPVHLSPEQFQQFRYN